MVNIDANKENTVRINVADSNLKKVSATILSSKALQDHNSFESPKNIVPKEFTNFKLKKGTLEITIPAFSVVVLEGKK